MGRIQSSIGVITGVPIQETVDNLIALSARPRNLLAQRTEGLVSQQTAITELTALVVGIQLSTNRLGAAELFQRKDVTSSDPERIGVTTSGSPSSGVYSFTPVRQAQAQQLLSGGIYSADEPLGAGRLTIQQGGQLDDALALEHLNGGAGVQRGRIRITDRSGRAETVDLRFAQTVDDVVQAINSSLGIDVRADVQGDRLVLQDLSGSTATNLRVQEVGLSTTAADLGLLGSVAQSELVGQDLVRLHDGLRLNLVNDGTGVNLRRELPDLQITFRDGSTPLQIDLDPPAQAEATTTAKGGHNAEVAFQAVQAGSAYDDVTIRFVHDGSVTQGNETVVYDDSDPANKTLTFSIEEGQTTASDIVAAVQNSPQIAAIFSASLSAGSSGTGVIDVGDTATTSGGGDRPSLSSITLGDVVDAINAADPSRLSARISSDGERLELVDLTIGAGTFSVTSPLGGSTAEDFGLTGAAVNGVISGRRLLAGLQSTLVTSLNGGQGFSATGGLGQLQLTDRAGATATVDLSTAETLADILETINGAGLAITASVNGARNGIQLTDTSGSSVSHLIVADADATNTAQQLGIAVDDDVTTVDSGTLRRQTFHEHLRLDELNQGAGVAKSSLVITDTNGATGAINLAVSDLQTVGELIDAINALGLGVQAGINAEGDGLQLVDTAGGSQTLSIREGGSQTTAADLGILGDASVVDLNGVPTQVITSSTTLAIDIDSDDTLQDLVTKVNAAGRGVEASIINDGSSTLPYRLSLVSQTSGSAGRLLVDTSQAGFSIQEVVAAQDALLVIGSPDSLGAGVLAASSSNEFDSVIDGVTLNVAGTSTTPVEVRVEPTDESALSGIQLFVDQYNRLRDKLDELTFFNEDESTTGVLFGTGEVLRIDTTLTNLLSGRVFGAGSIQSLEELGLSLREDGQLEFDREQFSQRFAADREAVEQFFSDEEFGISKRFNDAVELLAGEENSVLINRTVTLNRQIELNNERLERLDLSLDRERERLLKQFFGLESTIARLKSGLDSLSAIQPLEPL